jgi:hypothetical protein
MISPIDFVDSSELYLQSDSLRSIQTVSIPAGEKVVEVWVRSFKFKAGWMADSSDSVWLVWVQYNIESVAPRLLGIARTESDIDDILRHELHGHDAKSVHLIQQYVNSNT